MNESGSDAAREVEQLRAECSLLVQKVREQADQLADAQRLIEDHRRADFWRLHRAEQA